MRGALVVLAATAALAGCSGDSGAPGPPPTRATLGIIDAETFDECPPITDRRLSRQAIAFSGELSIEGPDSILWVIDVDRWYTGGDEDVVVLRGTDVSITYFQDTVQRGDGPGDPGQAVGDGDRLLVAGRAGPAAMGPPERNGLVSACLTQPWTPALAEQFAEVFATSSPRPRPVRGAG